MQEKVHLTGGSRVRRLARDPAVSGVVLQYLSWLWMLGIVLPVAGAITFAGLRRLTNLGEPRLGSVDWFSVALSAVGFGSFVCGLSQLGAASSGALVPPVLVIGFGAAAIGAFVWRQLVLQRSGNPLLDLRTLGRRTYAVSLCLMSVGFMAMLGSMILLYLQNVRRLDVLQTGLLVMPGGVAMGLLGPTVGRVCSTATAATPWCRRARWGSWSPWHC